MDKLKMESLDMTQENIKKIGALFPNVITETKDENGKLIKAINFDKLKRELANEVVDNSEESYDFTWVGKNEAIVEANTPIRKTLRPIIKDEVTPTGKDNNGNPYCSSGSKDFENTENLYIEGDNLDVLKLLQESYLGAVKMIYIDPPYNTGNDFIYNDNFHTSKDEYDEESGMYDDEGNRQFVQNNDTNPRFHSDWCSMIYARLKLAKNLLTDDGVIFISIDYNENFNVRKIADEIFGTSNFVGEIYWESKTKSQNTTTSYNKLQPKAEMILVYSRQEKRRFNLIQVGEKNYDLVDEKGAYREYNLEVMNANGVRGRETMVFDINYGEETISPPFGKQWKLGQDQISFYTDNKDLFIKDNKIIIKMRPDYERNETTEPFWGFFSKDLGTAESAKKELTEILGSHGFETVKPIEIIRRLIHHATEKSDIILDFFSGSATTAHAVMQLNAEDGGNRKFILVQLPEACDEKSEAFKAGYKNIPEIGKERIRRAGEKIKTEIEASNEQLKLEEEPKKVPDIGFRVLKLDDSNMKDVYYGANEIDQKMLDDMISNIKDDRTDIDLLYGVLLDWGLQLSSKHEILDIDGVRVHNYDDLSLVACFEENISESVIRKIADMKNSLGMSPLRVVFRDSSFASSPDKINVEEIFKLNAPNTRVKVI